MNNFHQSSLKIGIFDHLDDCGGDVGKQYSDRLRIAEACDRAGFYGYHVAEHHGTPHGFAPSPNLFLSAMAQRTRTLRLGPLVMLLSLYHPLRAFEEVCMLDQLSGGRVDLGIGRGAVPLELGFFGIAGEAIDGRYQEASDILLQAMRGGTLGYQGRYFTLQDVPITLSPVQKPHPPLWYGTVKPESAVWAAKRQMNIVSYGPASKIRGVTDAYRAAWAERAGDGATAPMLGMVRTVVIAETEKAARALAAPAYERWLETLSLLPRQSGVAPAALPAQFAEAVESGLCIAGTVSSVRAAILRQKEEAGINYLLCQTAFGDLPVEASLNTIAAMKAGIMPRITTAPSRSVTFAMS
jgi:alkanesulfonate monooxygenase SsuD/methylene tetrahydromethanopterin reductase-like flavin-dependent oxidoreductase (luciferase family)